MGFARRPRRNVLARGGGLFVPPGGIRHDDVGEADRGEPGTNQGDSMGSTDRREERGEGLSPSLLYSPLQE